MFRPVLSLAVLFLFAVSALLAEPPIVQIENKSPVLCLAWSADGKWLASGANDGTLRISEAATGKDVHSFSTGNQVSGLAISPDGKTVVINQLIKGTSLSTWDIATGKQDKICTLRDFKADQLTFTPDGKAVMGVTYGEFFQWALPTRVSGSQADFPAAAGAATISPEGSVMAWADPNGLVRIRRWDPINTTTMQIGPNRCIAFGPEGKLLAVVEEKNIQLWDMTLSPPEITATLTGLEKPVSKLSISANGKILAALADDGASMRTWDLNNRRSLRQIGHLPGKVTMLSLSPDGRLLAATGAENKILIWNAGARILTHKGAPVEIAQKDLTALWTELSDTDHDKSDAAWQRLGAAGDHAIPFLREQMRAIVTPMVDMKRIQSLISDLDSSSYETRENATKGLIAVGEPAVVPVKRILEKPPSPEVETRAKLIIQQIGPSKLTPERQRVLEAIELLEQMRTEKALGLLEEIAKESLNEQIGREAGAAARRAEKEKKE